MAHFSRIPRRPKIYFPDYGSGEPSVKTPEVKKKEEKKRDDFDPKKLCIKAEFIYLQSVKDNKFDKSSLQGLEFFYLLGLNLLEIYEDQPQFEAYVKSARKIINDLIDFRYEYGFWEATEDQYKALASGVDTIIDIVLNSHIGEVITNSVKAVRVINQDNRFGIKYYF